MIKLPQINTSGIVTKPVQPAGNRRYLLKQVADTPNTFTLQIDNSSLEVFNACARSAEYKLVHARQGGEKPALVYGGAIHDGLEHYYKNFHLPQYTVARDTLKEEMFEKASKKYETYSPPLGEWRTLDRACDTLSKYLNEYKDEPFKVRQVDDTPQVEIPFSLPLTVVDFGPGAQATEYTFSELVDPETWLPDQHPDSNVILKEVRVYWTGKIDVVIDLDMQSWIMDHKTSSMVGPTFFKDFELSQQTLGYCWAAEQIYNERFAGLLVNVLVGRKPTKTGIPTAFERQRYHYRQDQIDEWQQDVTTLVSDFVANLARSNFPKMTKWCVGKYGLCEYHEVCSLPPHTRLPILFSDSFVDSTWSPLND